MKNSDSTNINQDNLNSNAGNGVNGGYSQPNNGVGAGAGVSGDYESNSRYYTGETIQVSGVLEVLPDYGVLRQDEPTDSNLPKDVYISQSQIKRFSLRMGDLITGLARHPKEGERYLSMLKVEKVDWLDPEEARRRPLFSKLTAI